MDMIKALIGNEKYRTVIVLIIGIVIGVLFYPTKKVQEEVSIKYEQKIDKMMETRNKERAALLERYDQLSKEMNQKIAEYERKIVKLSVEIKDLKSKQKTSYYKIVRPDGTIEIKRFSETEVTESTKVITEIQEEFSSKIKELETRWSDVHKERISVLEKEYSSKEEEYRRTISDLEKKRTVSVNEKRFGLEIGKQTGEKYYGHLSADIAGPIFGGIHIADDSNNKEFGLGLGIRF